MKSSRPSTTDPEDRLQRILEKVASDPAGPGETAALMKEMALEIQRIDDRIRALEERAKAEDRRRRDWEKP
jgi:hypothetical protein